MTTNQWIDYLDADENYETSHPDAANSYDVLARGEVFNKTNQFIHESDIVSADFVTGYDRRYHEGRAYRVAYIYLGNSEMEVCPSAIGEPNPTDAQIEAIERETDWIWATHGFYQMYPDNLYVRILIDKPQKD